jgi:putative acetyltransferase
MGAGRPSPLSPDPRWSVRLAEGAGDIEAARRLFGEYRQWHLENQGVNQVPEAEMSRGLSILEAETAALPGEFVPPGGALVLAFRGETPVGCGALKQLRLRVAEIKRVYVRPDARGGGVGERIVRHLMHRAHELGHERLVLDTLPTMTGAIAMYRKIGFVSTEPYWAHPVARALFFEYRLGPTVDSGV